MTVFAWAFCLVPPLISDESKPTPAGAHGKEGFPSLGGSMETGIQPEA
jgi:hypothetical protein